MSKPRDRKLSPNPRTKPTVRQLGPRDPGPHGVTVDLRDGQVSRPKMDRGLPWFAQMLGANGPVDAPAPVEPTAKRTGRRGGQR